MTIYDKSIEALTTADLDQLLSERAIENVRLEFKSEVPSKDETLKKLSSFANTYGGYLIIGAHGDRNGQLQALPGIDPVSGFKQTVVQWCQSGTYPPIQAFVSNPIPTSHDPNKVCYVIFVDESVESPHFLNSRKGAYVRTDEFSHHFQPQLATYEEIVHLQNRRIEAVGRKLRLQERAEQRFGALVGRDYASNPRTSGTIGATLKLFISPRFPVRTLLLQEKLITYVKNERIPWRKSVFPWYSGNVFSQHESAVVLQPCSEFSFFETSILGHAFFALEI